MPVVVLCVLWPMLTRIDKRTAEIEKRVEEQADAIDQLMSETIGDERWREVQKQ